MAAPAWEAGRHCSSWVADLEGQADPGVSAPRGEVASDQASVDWLGPGSASVPLALEASVLVLEAGPALEAVDQALKAVGQALEAVGRALAAAGQAWEAVGHQALEVVDQASAASDRA